MNLIVGQILVDGSFFRLNQSETIGRHGYPYRVVGRGSGPVPI